MIGLCVTNLNLTNYEEALLISMSNVGEIVVLELQFCPERSKGFLWASRDWVLTKKITVQAFFC